MYCKNIAALLGGVCAAALASQALAQEALIDEVIVTGSRTIANGDNSPTPVTVVQAEQLKATTPTTIADALVKLPSFGQGRSVTVAGNPGSNSQGNFLNLRNFGIIRTLILQDGRRVAPSAADGTVDVNTLPEMLTRRVDIVTGGAAAVYGSDAVTGVVNYITDRHFNGLKYEISGGMSDQQDNGSWKFGLAAGKAFLDGRLHLEGSIERFRSDGIADQMARKPGANTYCLVGNGSTIPFVRMAGCRNNTVAFGGLILTGPGAGLEFSSNGILTPFVHGQPTLNREAEIGGSGFFFTESSLVGSQKTDQAFVRADFEVTDNVHAYAQVALNDTTNYFNFGDVGSTVPVTYSTNNPFLSAAAVAQLGGPDQTFRMTKMFRDATPIGSLAETKNLTFSAGLEGKFAGRIDWSAYYTHANTELTQHGLRNLDQAKLYAALDAVRAPGTGNIVCSATLTHPGLYPGCTPINPFGPDRPADSLAYAQRDTFFVLDNFMDDFGATIAGDVFNLPAGPVRVALTGEYREMRLRVRSDFRPSQLIQNSYGGNCAGLRFNCSPTSTSLLYLLNTSEPVDAKENIAEAALEANVPLLADMPFIKSLSVNGAVRYAEYSVSGGATTWKIGFDWHPNDEITVRGTRSRDIRAPTLSDLFQPPTSALAGYADTAHTGVTGVTVTRRQGNPDLIPEEADTTTIGVVYRPAWLPRFSMAVDYYDIQLDKAITEVDANDANSRICIQSNFTSPLCSLFVRPLPITDRSPANYPTLRLPRAMNVAKTWTHGVDMEANYAFNLSEVMEPLEGDVGLRLLATYQPVLNTITMPGQATIPTMGYRGNSKWRVNLAADYRHGSLRVNVLQRWKSSQKASFNQTYQDQHLPDAAYTDMSVSYDFIKKGQTSVVGFVSIQNLFDRQPTISVRDGNTALINFRSPVVPGEDVIGRYVTVGLRGRF